MTPTAWYIQLVHMSSHHQVMLKTKSHLVLMSWTFVSDCRLWTNDIYHGIKNTKHYISVTTSTYQWWFCLHEKSNTTNLQIFWITHNCLQKIEMSMQWYLKNHSVDTLWYPYHAHSKMCIWPKIHTMIFLQWLCLYLLNS